MFALLRTLFFLLFLVNTAVLANGFSNSSSSGFKQEVEFLPVEHAYQADLVNINGQWHISWQMKDGYFLYKHGFKQEWLNANQPQIVDIVLTNGIQKSDEYFGDVEIYYQQVMAPVAAVQNPTNTALFKATSQGCADAGLCYPPYSVYFSVDLTQNTSRGISAEDYQRAIKSPTPSNDSNADTSIGLMLLWALLGGIILNLMPCVLPVLSIKVMQLARHPDSASAKMESLCYLAGVLLSFTGIAALMLALRATGNAIGWGFQLQNPWFVAGLVYVFFILGLSMSGLLSFGQRFMGAGQSLTEQGGNRGAFFTGALAVVVASPCTGPFMSAALGFALTQSTGLALAIFATLGFGMALPILLISFIPALGRCLPKPGAWMEKLKHAFAFPLYASAIWLLWVYGNQTSTLGMASLLFGCLLLTMGLMLAASGRWLGKIVAFLIFILALAIPFTADKTGTHKTLDDDKVAYSAETLRDLRTQGRPIFINLTADWCITCIANEKSTLESSKVLAAFKEADVIYMVGDWTDYNADITQLLTQFGRSGIPLYVLYSRDPQQPPIILPQILTPSIVLNSLKEIESNR